MKTGVKALVWFAMALVCVNGFGQTHLPPVAQNDLASVTSSLTDTLPPADTINVTANDYSPSGDSFCVTAVYGAPYFSMLNCHDVVFNSHSFGKDTAWYVVCNDSLPDLCDTAMIVVTVARHYTPMMLNNSRWTVYAQQGDQCWGGDEISEEWIYYWTASDTMVNGTVYKQLYSEEDVDLNVCMFGFGKGTPTLMGYIRQDTLNQKVFFFGAGSANEVVLYDFNVAMPDTIQADAGDTSFVTSYGYFESNGDYYNQINIGNYALNEWGWSIYPSSWIEGIGSTLDPFSPPYNFGGISQLKCFTSNGVTIYPAYANDTCPYVTPLSIENIPTIQTSIRPNPTNGFCTLQLSASNGNLSAAIFDITGREVRPLFTNQTGSTFNFNVATLASGLYFVKVYGNNGRIGVSKLVKE